MIDERIHRIKLGFGVVAQQRLIIALLFYKMSNMIKQTRWLKFAIGFFTEMKNSQTRSEILIIGCFLRNEVSRRLNHGVMNILGANTIIHLQLRAHFHL